MLITFFSRMKWIIFIILLFVFCYPVGYFILDNDKKNVEIINNQSNFSGIGAYIINLDRSKTRFDYVKDSIYSLGLETQRIPAVDGHKLSAEEIEQLVDVDSYHVYLYQPLWKGTVGCSLSHFKVWEEFLKSNFEFALIFEDDISFDPQKMKIVLEDLVQNSNLWDLTSFEVSSWGMPVTIKTLTNDQKLVAYLTNITHAGAYIINRKAAKNLLAKARPIKTPVDHYFTRGWELDIKFTGIENPKLVRQKFGDSNIGETMSLQYIKLSPWDYCKHYMYKLQSAVIRFFYNFKTYFTIKEF